MNLARQMGVTPAAVVKAAKTGRITVGPDGTIDPVLAKKQWEANTDQTKPLNAVTGNPKHRKASPEQPKAPIGDSQADVGAQAGTGGPSYVQSRAIREAYQAKLAKLDYEERTGKLVNVDEVKVVAFNTARGARDRLISLPDRLSAILAGINDSFEIHRLLSAEIRIICEELSSGVSNFSRTGIH